MYDIKVLKDQCQEELTYSINADNVALIWTLADLYRAERLSQHARHYAENHADKVLKSAAYHTFVENNPQIAVHLGLSDGTGEDNEVSVDVEDSEVSVDVDSQHRHKRRKIILRVN